MRGTNAASLCHRSSLQPVNCADMKVPAAACLHTKKVIHSVCSADDTCIEGSHPDQATSEQLQGFELAYLGS